jgi:hypothetical protein
VPVIAVITVMRIIWIVMVVGIVWIIWIVWIVMVVGWVLIGIIPITRTFGTNYKDIMSVTITITDTTGKSPQPAIRYCRKNPHR